jgi:hypothetical protein
MRKRKAQQKFLHIGEILAGTLRRKKIPIHVADQHVSSVWDRAVGSIIAANTRAHNIKNGTLFVKVSTSVWMQQLQFMKQEIMDKVNACLENQTIRNINFSIGEVGNAMNRRVGDNPPRVDTSRLKQRDRRIIEESTAVIADGELKDIVKRVMTKEIVNRRTRQGKRSR